MKEPNAMQEDPLQDLGAVPVEESTVQKAKPQEEHVGLPIDKPSEHRWVN